VREGALRMRIWEEREERREANVKDGGGIQHLG